MCHCNPSIRKICCGAADCVPECKIDHKAMRALHISKIRSQEVLKEKGRELSFDDLIAAIYFQGWMDSANT